MRSRRFSSLEYEQHLNLGEPMNITAKSSARPGRTAAAVLAVPLLLGAGLAAATTATALEECPAGSPAACVAGQRETPAPGGPLVTVPPAVPTEPAPGVPTGSATIQPIPQPPAVQPAPVQPSPVQPTPVQPSPVQPAPPTQTLTPVPEVRYTPPGNPGVSTMDPTTGNYTEAVPSPVGVPAQTADAEPSPEASIASPTPSASPTASAKPTSTARSTAAPTAGSTGSATGGETAAPSPSGAPAAAGVERASFPLAVPALAVGAVALLILAAVLIYRRRPKTGAAGS